MLDYDDSQQADESISFLIFNINGTLAGIDTEQITELCDGDRVDIKNEQVISLAFDSPESINTEPGSSVKAIKVRYCNREYSIRVGMPREMITLHVTAVKPLPSLFSVFNDTVPVWGVAVRDGRIILLIDIFKYLSIHEVVSGER